MKNKLKSILNCFCQKVQTKNEDWRIPTKQKNSDIYIVEFPKSGITWFSTIIANINLIESKSKQRATYYNIQQLIPDIHMNRHILDEPIWDVPRYRFIKSHVEFCPFYNHVIYLVRNPVSVMNSYYHYISMQGQFEGTLEEFVKDPTYGLERWIKHVESWLFQGDSSQRIHVIRYEDLKQNIFTTIKELYVNLGLLVEEKSILESIDLASFEHMKETETLYKKYNPNTSLVFVREGKTGDHGINESIEKYILDRTDHIRNKLGYS